MRDFKAGEYYSRRDISDTLGGELDTYLPQHEGEIVCGCFTHEKNPGAPNEIQVGDGPVVVQKAELLSRQKNKTIPVFLKDEDAGSARCWQYFGDYRFKELVSDKAAIRQAERISERENIVYLLRLAPEAT